MEEETKRQIRTEIDKDLLILVKFPEESTISIYDVFKILDKRLHKYNQVEKLKKKGVSFN